MADRISIFFLYGLLFMKRSVEAGPADSCQFAHALDTQAAWHRHHFADLLVDAVSPFSLLFWRRASTFCRAPFEKIHFQGLLRQQPF
jgi:hypothetical protein